MAGKKTQYVLLPAMGTVVSQTNQHQLQFFEVLHNSLSVKGKNHTLQT
jgi:hypothetical protein